MESIKDIKAGLKASQKHLDSLVAERGELRGRLAELPGEIREQRAAVAELERKLRIANEAATAAAAPTEEAPAAE